MKDNGCFGAAGLLIYIIGVVCIYEGANKYFGNGAGSLLLGCTFISTIFFTGFLMACSGLAEAIKRKPEDSK